MKIFDGLYAFLWNNPAANNCNTYLIRAEKNILIDPGHHLLFGRVRDELSRLSLTPGDVDVVIVTHGHPDHLEGVKDFTGDRALIGLHEAEMDLITKVAPRYGEALGAADFQPDFFLDEGDLTAGDLSFQILHTPGHSPGSICLYWPEKKALFTGDLVFDGGVGRTDLPGGNGEELKMSIKRASALEVDYLLPGHGEMVAGRDRVAANFAQIEGYWFAFL